MKVVIAGGSNEAEFIVGMFSKGNNEVIVINPNGSVVDRIGKRKKIAVYHGEPWRKYCLEEANAFDADVFVSLCPSDTDNYASCIMAKTCFNAKKCICLVNNPLNVDLYRKLGIETVISSPYTLGKIIQDAANVENIVRTISLENDQIKVLEALVLSNYNVCNKTLREIRFPKYCSVAAVFRSPTVLIPNGDTLIEAKDTLLIICAPGDEEKVRAFVQKPADKKVTTVKKSVRLTSKPKTAPKKEKAPKKIIKK